MNKIFNTKQLKALCIVFFAFCLCTVGAFSAIVVSSADDAAVTCAEAGCGGHYVDGVCSKETTHYQAPKLNEVDYDLNSDGTIDAVYEIENAGHLLCFGQYVNNGTYDANAILKADIDMADYEWKPLGSTELYYDGLYNNEAYFDTGYSGIFDGGYHKISNLSVGLIAGESWSYGFVGTLSGTVKNLIVESFIFTYSIVDTAITDMRTGAIAGQMLVGGTVENCLVKGAVIDIAVFVVGGIAGCNYNGVIKNCMVIESTVAGSSTRYGYIVGDNHADGGPRDRLGTVIDCYADASPLVSSKTLSSFEGVAKLKSAVAFANGEVAYLLGSAWGQKIGTDPYPVFGGDKVYCYALCNGAIRYSNEEHPNESCVDANNDNICENCGYSQNDSMYHISTANQLESFAELVNSGVNTAANAKLENDIDLSGSDKEIMIGNSYYAYSGTFDGQNKTIKNYRLNLTSEGTYGLFSYLKSATVKDFSINGEISIVCENKICFGVIGTSGTDSKLTNIHSSLNVTVQKGSGTQIGGIVATVDNGTRVNKCSYSGTLDMGANEVGSIGGIVGYANDEQLVYITNCAFYGTIKSTNTESNQLGGILGYYRGANLSLQNCLSVGAINAVDTTENGAIIAILRAHGEANTLVINNYYLEGTQPFGDYDSSSKFDDSIFDSYKWQTISGSSTATTTAQFASGKVTYALNAGVTDGTQAWYQTLSSDNYPVFSGGTVYGSVPCAMHYSNSVIEGSVEHSGGTATCQKLAVCSGCGEEYGELGDHVMSTEWTTENGQHFHKCTVEGCQHTADREDCSAGATKGVCGDCGATIGGSSSGNNNATPPVQSGGCSGGAADGSFALVLLTVVFGSRLLKTRKEEAKES